MISVVRSRYLTFNVEDGDSPRGSHGLAVHCGVPPLPSSGATRSLQTKLGNSNVPGGPLLILRRPPLKALFLPSWSTYQEAPSRGPPAALLCPSQGPSCPPPAALLGGPLGGLFAPPTCPPRGASETAVRRLSDDDNEHGEEEKRVREPRKPRRSLRKSK